MWRWCVFVVYISCGAAAPTTAAAAATADPSTPKESVKSKCDPYGQGGVPLSADVIRSKVLPTLQADAWTLSPDAKTLTRSFRFASVANAFRFVEQTGNISVNGGHNAYSIALTPRKAEVSVVLKTIPLAGLSWNDAYFAFQLDQVFALNERMEAAAQAKSAASGGQPIYRPSAPASTATAPPATGRS